MTGRIYFLRKLFLKWREEAMMELLRKVAQYIVQTDLSKIPLGVTEKAKNCILDGIGCGLYGQEFEAAKIMLQLTREWNGRPEASIIGAGIKVPSAMAAKVNGIAIHVADFDDASVPFRGHPTAVVLPPVLALCESKLKSGNDLLLAYILGVELGGKLGDVMGMAHFEAGWHGTGTIGTIASAAASAKILGLNEEETCHALAIATSGASGIRENFGTMVKSLHAGQASEVGALAAILAERGFKGSLTAFEGKCGYWRVFSGKGDISHWVDESNEFSTVLGITPKRYPSCAATHPALDAIEDLMKEYLFSWEDVEEVKCFVPPINLSTLPYPNPNNDLEAKFSMQYCVSAFLVNGKLDISHFEPRALNDQKVRRLIEKIRMVPDESLGELVETKGIWSPTDVQIKLKKQTISKKMLGAKGSVSYPLSTSEFVEKFRSLAGRSLPAERIDKVLNLVTSLESLHNITTLMETFHP
jgi:2-methylcitrate dehydratase PrpD